MSASPETQPDSPVAAPSPGYEDDQTEDVKAPTPDAGDQDEEPAAPADEASPNADDALDDDDEEKAGGGSDDESILSEVDEAQFEDFDPENVDIEDRPQLAIDEDNLKLIGRHKRKRDGDGDGERSRRKREGRREKKTRRMKELEEGSDGEGSSSRRRERKKKETVVEDEELLDPATRRFTPVFWPERWYDGISNG